MMHRYTFATAVFAAGALVATANAQQSDGVLVDVDDCIALGTRAQQIQCYEERVNEVLRARESDSNTSEQEAAAVSDPTTAPELSRAERRAARRDAREAESLQRELERRQVAAAEAALAAAQAAAAVEDSDYTAGEIVAEVTALREMAPDAYMITLDNGQIWRQDLPKRYPLFVGASVVLRPGNWGPSYRLTDPRVGNFIQVRLVN